MRFLFIIFVGLFLFFLPQQKDSNFKYVESYISTDLNQPVSDNAIFVIIPLNMCYSCLLAHIKTLNQGTKPLNIIFIGRSSKKNSFKTKSLTGNHLNIIYDSKSLAMEKNICSSEELVVFLMADKKVVKIPYNDFKSLADEID